MSEAGADEQFRVGLRAWLVEHPPPAVDVAGTPEEAAAAASSRERAARVTTLAAHCGVAEDQVIPCSAVTGEGRDELAASLVALLATPADVG